MAKRTSKEKTERKRITFSCEAANAEAVFMLGDFNNWNPETHPMKKDSDGRWRKTLLLHPGTYQYKFLIDGNWSMDPLNDQTCANCFGTKNNVLNISAT